MLFFVVGDYRELVVSDFAAAEFASALGRRVRTRDLVADDVRAIFRDFDAWATEHSRFVTILAGDTRKKALRSDASI